MRKAHIPLAAEATLETSGPQSLFGKKRGEGEMFGDQSVGKVEKRSNCVLENTVEGGIKTAFDTAEAGRRETMERGVRISVQRVDT